jgi:lipopolysaccharide/colanic/teichoic acid biosynthesis glycosyltransferase
MEAFPTRADRHRAQPASSWANLDRAFTGERKRAPVEALTGISARTGSPGFRRPLNVVASALLIVATAPLMLLIALLVKLTSRGPVFYTQTRVGIDRRNGNRPPPGCRRRFDQGGMPFRIYKFRTMTEKYSNGGAQVWAVPKDPRVTPLGRVLRDYRLDELPQLFNVLRGEMNLVGPRPEQPKIFSELRAQIPEYNQRQKVLPGITGLAQVSESYDTSTEGVKKKLALDMEYIERESTLADLRIMLQTAPTVLFKRGAW